MGDCLPCPAHATTLRPAATSLSDCICDSGWFLDNLSTTAVRTCSACPMPGTECVEAGVTLATLPLSPGYWRSGRESIGPRRCPMSGNVPGKSRCAGWNVTCSGLLSGIYCTACPNATYLDRSGECVNCTEPTTGTLLICSAMGAALLLGLLLLLCSTSSMRACDTRIALRRMSVLAESTGMAAKAKMLVSFCERRGDNSSCHLAAPRAVPDMRSLRVRRRPDGHFGARGLQRRVPARSASRPRRV